MSRKGEPPLSPRSRRAGASLPRVARRIAVVSYFYPPDRSVGSHRWPPIARYLRERGHEVTIVTTSAFGSLPDDRPWVVRTGDLQAAPALRRALRRPAIINAEGRPSAAVAPPPRLLTNGPVPDAHVLSWLPFVVRALRRVVAERAIDCVVTNGPPDATHLAPLALRRVRPAWVADLEDGWRFEPQRAPWPTRTQDRMDAALEGRVARRADVLVGLSAPIAEDLRARYAVDARCITNAWDPWLEKAVAGGASPPLDPGTFTLVHTGSLSHASRRDPTSLLTALERLVREDERVADRFRLVLAGRLTADDARLLDALSPAVAPIVRHLGELDRADAVALQREAGALLLLATGGQRSVVTGKLFEYLASGRPILALSDENEAARIVRATATGVVVSPYDSRAVATVLRRAVDGELERAFAPRDLDRYRHPAPAIAFERAIEDAIAARSARRGQPGA